MMKADFSYDPVTVIEEVDAIGEIAEIFADIRRTMNIPLVTSIWRGLSGMDDGLRQTWSASKPIFEAGEPDRALSRVMSRVGLPTPQPLTASQLSCVGVQTTDVADIRNVIAAYNRSNGMNLVALAALVNSSDGSPLEPAPVRPHAWPKLRPLLRRAEITENVWQMVRDVNQFGALSRDASVATLWRHLARWPGFLALVYAAFAPLHAEHRVDGANEEIVSLAAQEGRRMASLRATQFALSERVLETISGYVSSPTQVARMVTMGHAMARWIH